MLATAVIVGTGYVLKLVTPPFGKLIAEQARRALARHHAQRGDRFLRRTRNRKKRAAAVVRRAGQRTVIARAAGVARFQRSMLRSYAHALYRQSMQRTAGHSGGMVMIDITIRSQASS
jgi:hypothetical protein